MELLRAEGRGGCAPRGLELSCDGSACPRGAGRTAGTDCTPFNPCYPLRRAESMPKARRHRPAGPSEAEIESVIRATVLGVKNSYNSLLLQSSGYIAAAKDQGRRPWEILLDELLQTAGKGCEHPPRECAAWYGNVRHKLSQGVPDPEHVLVVLHKHPTGVPQAVCGYVQSGIEGKAGPRGICGEKAQTGLEQNKAVPLAIRSGTTHPGVLRSCRRV